MTNKTSTAEYAGLASPATTDEDDAVMKTPEQHDHAARDTGRAAAKINLERCGVLR